jgi:DNA-binding CsgD family transcriptional regulator
VGGERDERLYNALRRQPVPRRLADAIYRAPLLDEKVIDSGAPLVALRTRKLTRRQREVLQLIADGYTQQSAAACLCLTADAVRRHLRYARMTLRAATTPHAVKIALETGQIS